MNHKTSILVALLIIFQTRIALGQNKCIELFETNAKSVVQSIDPTFERNLKRLKARLFFKKNNLDRDDQKIARDLIERALSNYPDIGKKAAVVEAFWGSAVSKSIDFNSTPLSFSILQQLIALNIVAIQKTNHEDYVLLDFILSAQSNYSPKLPSPSVKIKFLDAIESRFNFHQEIQRGRYGFTQKEINFLKFSLAEVLSSSQSAHETALAILKVFGLSEVAINFSMNNLKTNDPSLNASFAKSFVEHLESQGRLFEKDLDGSFKLLNLFKLFSTQNWQDVVSKTIGNLTNGADSYPDQSLYRYDIKYLSRALENFLPVDVKSRSDLLRKVYGTDYADVISLSGSNSIFATTLVHALLARGELSRVGSNDKYLFLDLLEPK